MEKKKKIELLENRAERTQYTGKFNDFQTFGSSFKGKRYSTAYEQDPYSEYQNFLYKRALFGLKMYKEDEIKAMHPDKRKRIKKVHKRAQHVLNVLKQERLIEITNKFFAIFKQSSLAGGIVDVYSEPDPTFISKSSFKDLGIDKETVVKTLLEKKVLPPNFKTIKK
jgi:hypothetical protein